MVVGVPPVEVLVDLDEGWASLFCCSVSTFLAGRTVEFVMVAVGDRALAAVHPVLCTSALSARQGVLTAPCVMGPGHLITQ